MLRTSLKLSFLLPSKRGSTEPLAEEDEEAQDPDLDMATMVERKKAKYNLKRY